MLRLLISSTQLGLLHALCVPGRELDFISLFHSLLQYLFQLLCGFLNGAVSLFNVLLTCFNLHFGFGQGTLGVVNLMDINTVVFDQCNYKQIYLLSSGLHFALSKLQLYTTSIHDLVLDVLNFCLFIKDEYVSITIL